MIKAAGNTELCELLDVDPVKGMYPAPHIHEHLATANCVHLHAQHEQPGAHCEQWHGTPQCTLTRTLRSSEHARAPSVDAHVFTHRTCGSRSRLVCHSISSMHAHLCLVP